MAAMTRIGRQGRRDKDRPAMVFRLSRVTEQLAGLLRERCDSRHLIA
jgi:hypothetical protein